MQDVLEEECGEPPEREPLPEPPAVVMDDFVVIQRLVDSWHSCRNVRDFEMAASLAELLAGKGVVLDAHTLRWTGPQGLAGFAGSGGAG